MFCPKCGKEMANDALKCQACGTPSAGARASIAPLMDTAKRTSTDAWSAARTFGLNPVGGLSVAFESVGQGRALAVGIAFGILYDICALLGMYLLIRRNFAAQFGLYNSEVTLGQFAKLLVMGVVPLVSFAAASFLTRLLFRGRGSIEGDVFVAGAALVPAALFWLIAGVLGVGNAEVIFVVAVFVVCYTILILFTGATRISAIPEVAATPAVCTTIIVTLWLAKIVLTALFV